MKAGNDQATADRRPAAGVGLATVPCIASPRDARDTAWLLEEAISLLAGRPPLELDAGFWFMVRSEAAALLPIELTVNRMGIEIVPLGEWATDRRLALPYDGGTRHRDDTLARARETLASWLASVGTAHDLRSPNADALREGLEAAAEVMIAAYAAAGVAVERAWAYSGRANYPPLPRFMRSGADGAQAEVGVLLVDLLARIAPPFRAVGRGGSGWPAISVIEMGLRREDVGADRLRSLRSQIDQSVLEEIIANRPD